MKMYDAGEKPGESDMDVMPMKKDKKYYPHIDFNSKQFPMIDKMEVGKKYMLMIEVKPTRKSIREKEGKEARHSMCMEVSKVGMGDKDYGMSKDKKMDKMVDDMYPDDKKSKK